MTNSWTDIRNTDLAVVMGGNAAEAHPCGFKWVTEAKAHRGAKLIVIDPRYTRTASVADHYVPIRQGTDIAFLLGVIRYCMENNKVQWEYVKNFTNAPLVVKDGFTYQDGLFSGYDESKRTYDKSTWEYDIGPDGFAVVDMTLQNPRCVWNLLKDHVSIYTPEMVERICGVPKEKFLKAAGWMAETSAPDKAMTSMYALGWTQHSKGSQNIRTMAMLQLILGNIGIRGGGMNALRGHSNIQGLTDLGLMSELMPGYLNIPQEKEPDLKTYLSTRQYKPLRPNQTSYWQNYPKFYVSLQKALWGDAATAQNDWAYNYIPKLDKPMYDALQAFELMHQGKMTGYFCQGFNPILAFPNRGKLTEAFSKLKWLVTMDPLDTETSRFWENHGVYNEVDTASIQTEVIQLPTTCFAEEEGALVNSGRWLQWHWPAGTPPGEAQHDNWIMGGIFLRLRELYKRKAARSRMRSSISPGTTPTRTSRNRRSLRRNTAAKALADLYDPTDKTKLLVAAGKQLLNFSQLRDDGTTSCGCWIYSGAFNEAGNNMARRDNTDKDGLGTYARLVVVVAGQSPHPL